MNIIEKIDLALNRLQTKSRFFLSFLLGAITFLGLAPISLSFFSILTFPILLRLLDFTENKKHQLLIGFLFGLGYFTFGLYWISNALFVDIKKLFILLPIALFLLPSLLSTFIAAACYLTEKFAKSRPEKILVFTLLLSLAEYLRGILFTGFPWNLFGMLFSHNIYLAQIINHIGIYGFTFCTIYICCSVYGLFHQKSSYIIISSIIFMSFYIYGIDRINRSNVSETDISLLIVQPNIAQTEKWTQQHAMDNLQQYIQMSLARSKDAKIIIWPESAVTFPIDDQHLRQTLKQVVPHNGLLLTGSVRVKGDDWYHGMFAIDQEGDIIGHYYKSHLVPFGEYVPLRSILNLPKVTFGLSDWAQGEGLESIKLDNIPEFSPLICYEIIFPGNVKKQGTNPKWLLNLTNDGWYGYSIGPFQHLEISRMRAIEEAIPVVRANNSGISAIIDSYGRVVLATELQKAGTLSGNLPAAIKPGLYSKYENKIFLIMEVLMLAFIIITRSIKLKK